MSLVANLGAGMCELGRVLERDLRPVLPHLPRAFDSGDQKELSARFHPIAETIFARENQPGQAKIEIPKEDVTSAVAIALHAEIAGIMTDFANRMAGAMATAEPAEVRGILRILKEWRASAIAAAKTKAAHEKDGRRSAQQIDRQSAQAEIKQMLRQSRRPQFDRLHR